MTLDDFIAKVKAVPDLYEDIGKQLAGELVCDTCRRVEKASAEQAARYMRDGWPKCCGYTMVLATEVRRE